MRRTVTTRKQLGVLALALVGLLTGSAPAVAAPAPPYKVSYDFLLNAARYGDAPSSPGENIWTCKPSLAHPEPVVLVHGTFGSAGGNWATYSALLADAGYCVYALTYGVPPAFVKAGIPVGGINSLESSAAQLRSFVDRVMKATGAGKVDLVGHSQGTLIPDYYVKFLGGAGHVDKYVSLAPLWHGTFGSTGASELPAGFSLPICAACTEMEAGSSFIKEIQAGGAAFPGIKYTNIMSEHDELVVPYTSGIQAGMTNIVLQHSCPRDLTDHTEIASDPVAAAYVLNALDPAHPVPVPCEVVLPGVGPLPIGG